MPLWLPLHHVTFTHNPPPHLDAHRNRASRIKEVVEAHILQVKEAASLNEGEEDQGFSYNIPEVFATERKKHNDKASKMPKLLCPPPPQARTTNSSSSQPNAHFHYQSHEEDQHLVSELEDYLMQGKLSLTMPVHIFTANPGICKNIINKPKA